jgi:hypothetical protein
MGILSDDLYDYAKAETWPRIGRPTNCDVESWTPERVPVAAAELDVFEAWFGDMFDELFGPCR